jgi:uncharacterized protein YPO0396
MAECFNDSEFATEFLERRWFAAQSAVKAMQSECISLLHTLRFAELAWRSAQAKVAELEDLRDDLEQRLAMLDCAASDTAIAAAAAVRSAA